MTIKAPYTQPSPALSRERGMTVWGDGYKYLTNKRI